MPFILAEGLLGIKIIKFILTGGTCHLLSSKAEWTEACDSALPMSSWKATAARECLADWAEPGGQSSSTHFPRVSKTLLAIPC